MVVRDRPKRETAWNAASRIRVRVSVRSASVVAAIEVRQ
jgi:hypothetical protein